MSKYAVIKGYLKHSKKKIDVFEGYPSRVQALSAFNLALENLEDFIDTYESGVLPKEFIDDLINMSEGK